MSKKAKTDVNVVVLIAGGVLVLTYFGFALYVSFIVSAIVNIGLGTGLGLFQPNFSTVIGVAVAVSSVEFTLTLLSDRMGPLFYLYVSPVWVGIIAVKGIADSQYLREVAKTIMERIRTPPSFLFLLK